MFKASTSQIGINNWLNEDNLFRYTISNTEGFDSIQQPLIETIEKIIHRMVEEEHVTVLLIEHNMHFVRRVANTCAYLDDGVIAKSGPTAEVLDDKNVRNSYLGL